MHQLTLRTVKALSALSRGEFADAALGLRQELERLPAHYYSYFWIPLLSEPLADALQAQGHLAGAAEVLQTALFRRDWVVRVLLQSFRGPSYIYAILMDRRIRGSD